MNKKQIYNADLKEEFLKQFKEETRKVYRYAFYRSFDTEDVLEKDLYNFTLEEIKDALLNANHTTYNSLRLTFQVFDDYIDWAIKKGLTQSNINLLKAISTDELRSYIDYTKKLYISEDELKDMEKELVNAADYVILIMLFEGVGGYGLSEMLNLTSDDIDFDTNILHLKDDKYGERKLIVSNDCMRAIRSALRETEYQNKNGLSEGRAKTSKLVDNNYVIKSVNKQTKNYGKADKHTIYRRISTISDYFKLPYLTAKNIEKSGMIKMGKDLYERDGKIEKEQLYKIANRFGVRKVKIGEYEYYNISILKEFINKENILELYGIEIK